MFVNADGDTSDLAGTAMVLVSGRFMKTRKLKKNSMSEDGALHVHITIEERKWKYQ